MRVLHAGCGDDPLPKYGFGDCEEVRLDIDPSMKPDIVASIVDMGDIGRFDAIYCSHALEHLYPHDVLTALTEFRRVLKPDGYALIFVPDLEDVRPTEEVLYVSPGGPITGLDMFYGHAGLVATMPYMAHHCGFTAETLRRVCVAAGFDEVLTQRLAYARNLMAVARNRQ
jgi:SAM-dependent methyltransferase